MSRKTPLITAFIVAAVSSQIVADIPAGYYDSADPSSPQALKESLHLIINDHQRFPYTSSETDTWDILEEADQDPVDETKILDVYKNASFTKFTGGNDFYNREHTWPKSYGFPDNDGSSPNYPYTDAHHLFLSFDDYNSERSNKPYENCDSNCTELATDFNHGRGGTSTQSNYTKGEFTDGSWETWSGRKGDVARALFYLAVRYEGAKHGSTSAMEPDLKLTNDRTLIDQFRTNENEHVAYMGMLSALLEWHEQDPVDDIERRRNDVIYSFQGNRNPFIDHPEYVACVFLKDCSALSGSVGDTDAPAPLSGLQFTTSGTTATISWDLPTDNDVYGYYAYQPQSDGRDSRLSSVAFQEAQYVLSGLSENTVYRIKISVVDTSGNESELSSAIEVRLPQSDPDPTPQPQPTGSSGGTVHWITLFLLALGLRLRRL